MSPILLGLIVLLCIGAIIAWLVPDASVKALIIKVLTVIVIVVLLVWVLGVFGVLPKGVHL